jgi:hypothetical protein
MNATETKYNPFRAAAAAAFAELSSEQAQHFYSLKAQKDVQTVLDNSITLFSWVFQLAELTYTMGIQCRAWCNALEPNAQATVLAMPMLATGFEAVADPWQVQFAADLMLSAKSSQSVRYRSRSIGITENQEKFLSMEGKSHL